MAAVLVAACALGTQHGAHAPGAHEPSVESVKDAAYWRALASRVSSESEAAQLISRALAADRRHMFAWHWLLKLVLEHARGNGGAWPTHLVGEPSTWVDSDNGGYWHLRAVAFQAGLRTLPADEAERAVRHELELLWRGHWRQGHSESRWSYHRQLLDALHRVEACTAAEVWQCARFVEAHPELAHVARYMLRPPAHSDSRAERGASAALLEALCDADPMRRGMYRDWLEEVHAACTRDAPASAQSTARQPGGGSGDTGSRSSSSDLGVAIAALAGHVRDACRLPRV